MSESNIIQRIFEQANNYKLCTRATPCVAYIGTEDMVELQKALDEQGYHRNRDTIKQERLNICGLYIYVVDAPHHMNIA